MLNTSSISLSSDRRGRRSGLGTGARRAHCLPAQSPAHRPHSPPAWGEQPPQGTCTPPSLSLAVVGDTELRQKTRWSTAGLWDPPTFLTSLSGPQLYSLREVGVTTLTPTGIPGFLASIYGFCISSHLWGASPFLLSSGERKKVVQRLGGRRPCGAFGEL